MSTTATLLQTAAGTVANLELAFIVRTFAGLSLFVALAVFFKPLLVGIARALVLVVNPRLTKEERAARRHMRDAEMLHRMISASDGPSHAAELRAMAARA